jgi:hypothetical protein
LGRAHRRSPLDQGARRVPAEGCSRPGKAASWQASYVKTLNYRTGEATARKLALYDSQGRKLWEKGGEFFSPTLVALSPDGGRLTVADGANTLYTLDARGHFVSQLRFPVNPKTDTRPTIQEAVATPDAGIPARAPRRRPDLPFEGDMKPRRCFRPGRPGVRRARSAADIAAFIARDATDEAAFDRLARRVFAHQYQHNAPYRAFCDGRGVRPGDGVASWRDIPAVPAAAFKRFVLSGAAEEACAPERGGRVFHSSGTTGAQTSRHFLDAAALDLYRASLRAGFRRFVLPDAASPVVFGLLPPPSEAPHSSLSFMLGELVADYGGRFFHRDGWQQALALELTELETPVVLFGNGVRLGPLFRRGHGLLLAPARQPASSRPAGSRGARAR